MKIKFNKILVYLFIVFALLFILGPFVYISKLAFKLPIHLLMAQFPFPPTWYNFHYVLFAKSATEKPGVPLAIIFESNLGETLIFLI